MFRAISFSKTLLTHSKPYALRGTPVLTRFSSSDATTIDNEKEIIVARKWLAKFTSETIPKSVGDLTFSRSSGPGGQNVNKVNSKATLRLPFGLLSDVIPSLLHEELKASPYYARNTDSLVINASESRKQSDNVQLVYQKLSALILEAGARVVPGETSAGQRAKVKGLQSADNERRIKMKKMQSSKKNNRRSGFD